VPNPISKKEIEEIEARGGTVNLMAKIISMPVLESIARHFHEMKHEQAENYKAAMEAKLKKMDEMIVAIGKPTQIPGLINLVKIMTELKALQVAHEKHELEEDDDEHEPCAYKVTGKRDRRGFIDLEHGLTFTPVPKDE
jgi:hypothetical protein